MPSRRADPDAAESFRRRTLRRAGDWLERASPLERSPTREAENGQFLYREQDGRSYELYVPESYDPDHPTEPVPLVVMLHGCRQSAGGFAAETGMNEVAAEEGFLVAYPQQSRLANPLRCWRWYDDGQATRGNGELASIAGVTRAVADEFVVDPDRIYVAGLSAGGAMAAQAIVEYPDLYAAAAVHSGLAYDAADGLLSGLRRMQAGGRDRLAHGSDRRGGESSLPPELTHTDRPLPTLVVHGTDDDVVDVANGRRLTGQVVRASGLAGGGDGAETPVPDPDDVETGTTGTFDFTRRRFRDGLGRVIVEEWLVDGMGHGWSGGGADGSYTAPEGPDASRLAWAFFERHRRSELEAPAPLRIALPGLGTVELPRPTRRGLSRVVARTRPRVRRLIGG